MSFREFDIIPPFRSSPSRSFDKNITFHKQVAYSLTFFSLGEGRSLALRSEADCFSVHILAHMVNFARFGLATKT